MRPKINSIYNTCVICVKNSLISHVIIYCDDMKLVLLRASCNKKL